MAEEDTRVSEVLPRIWERFDDLQERSDEQEVLKQIGVLVSNLYDKLTRWIARNSDGSLQAKSWKAYADALRDEKNVLGEHLDEGNNFQVDYCSSVHIDLINKRREEMPHHQKLLEAMNAFCISGQEFNFFRKFKAKRSDYAHDSNIDPAVLRTNFCSIYKETEEQNNLDKLLSINSNADSH